MPNWKKVAVSGSAASFASISVDTSITASIVSSSQFIGNLSGTASYATFALSASSAPGTTVNFTQATAAPTWSFTHNLNTQYPVVQVYDATYSQIIPNAIVGTTANTVQIRFDYSQSGYAVASNGGGLIVTGSMAQLSQSVAALTWSFAHNLNSRYINFEVYDSSNYVVIPAGIQALTSNTAEIYFATPSTGIAVANFSGLNGAPNATSASYALTASFAATASYFITSSVANATSASYALSSSLAQTASYVVTAQTASYVANAQTASYVLQAVSSSYALTSSYLNPVTSGYVVLTQVSASLNFADDAAAAASGVPLGGLYRNGNFILIRIS